MSAPRRFLAADIGGTKTAVACVTVRDDDVVLDAYEKYPSHEFTGLAPIVRAYLAKHPETPREAAAFGVAGPVHDGVCSATNLPWVVDARAIAKELGLGSATLMNDFEAVAFGVTRLRPDQQTVIVPGMRVHEKPIGVLGAGTGLGEAMLACDGAGYRVVGSEGGHADFAPRGPDQMELLATLTTRYGRVSYERVLSGLGLHNVYDHFKSAGVLAESAATREALARGDDLGVVMSTRAIAGDDELAMAVMGLFVDVYGAEAGNVALRGITRGGVFVAGGIAAKILPLMTDGRFAKAYGDKGRLSSLVQSIEVTVVTDEHVGLFGAAVGAAAAR